uniref:SMP-LTD domain-containing protein n=1 Tax=Trypanosoma vivax (strain Y486) TaxID=1055687 RepID=G0TRI1_TRYVY|nr:conserved hypothetical protein [Trypanosoma vivax Y486]
MSVLCLFLCGWVIGVAGMALCLLRGTGESACVKVIIDTVVVALLNRLTGLDTTPLMRTKIVGMGKPQAQRLEGSAGSSVGMGVHLPRLTLLCEASMQKGSGIEGASVFACKLTIFNLHMTFHKICVSQSIGSHGRVITSEELVCRAQLDHIKLQSVAAKSARQTPLPAEKLRGGWLLVTLRCGQQLSTSNQCDGGFVGGRGPVKVMRNGESFAKRDESESLAVTSELCTPVDRHMETSVVEVVGTCGCFIGVSGLSDDGANESIMKSVLLMGKRTGKILLKFHTARDQERFQNLVEGGNEVKRWCDYVSTMQVTDAFNVVLARILFQSLRTAAFTTVLREKIQKALDKVSHTKFPREVGGRILLDDVTLSYSVPTISNVTEPLVVSRGEMIFDFDLLYCGEVTLALRSNMTYRGIRIPHFTASVKITRVSARLRVSIGPPPSKVFWIACLSPPDLSLEVQQGTERGRGPLHWLLTSLPDLSGIFTNLIKLHVLSDMFLPVMDDFPLPNVEKTPPTSPSQRRQKQWDMQFERNEAAKQGRSRQEVVASQQRGLEEMGKVGDEVNHERVGKERDDSEVVHRRPSLTSVHIVSPKSGLFCRMKAVQHTIHHYGSSSEVSRGGVACSVPESSASLLSVEVATDGNSNSTLQCPSRDDTAVCYQGTSGNVGGSGGGGVVEANPADATCEDLKHKTRRLMQEAFAFVSSFSKDNKNQRREKKKQGGPK